MSRLTEALNLDTQFGFLDRALPAGQIFNPELIVNASTDASAQHAGEDRSMLAAIKNELRQANEFIFSVAFIAPSGLAPLKQQLLDFTGRGTIITSRYLDFNEPAVFRELLQLTEDNPNIEVLIHEDVDHGFHAKGYIFRHEVGMTAIVGSSNVTGSALSTNQEWNLKFSALPGGDIVEQTDKAVAYQKSTSVALSAEWIENYEQTRRHRDFVVTDSGVGERINGRTRILPNVMQSDALEQIQRVVDAGEQRAVVISATGTGKTILAALAVRQFAPKRMLFIVHSADILAKAKLEFQKVLEEPDSAFGFYSGGTYDLDAKYLFATIQTISRDEHLLQFAKKAFDYIVIDEVHRSGAKSYRKVVDHFEPEFLLGLTATPERTDNFNVFELFDYNVPYEIRLDKALKGRMLVPFHYYGIADPVDSEGTKTGEQISLGALTDSSRVRSIVDNLQTYGHAEGAKGLIFCSRVEECQLLAEELNGQLVYGKPLRTRALTGSSTNEERQQAIAELQAGHLDYLLTVDIFNEGVDIPELNQIVMLRETKSRIIFTQQLGRGLRKAAGKDHVRVLDFIGNYANNYMIPLALTGDNTGTKEGARRDTMTPTVTAGGSTISFDRIAQQRVLHAIDSARLTGRRELRAAITLLRDRLNRIPQLRHFLRFDSLDPYVLATTERPRNYWTLLVSLKFLSKDMAPSVAEESYLSMLSAELLKGIRPHEILLLQRLLEVGELTRDDFRELLREDNTRSDDAVITHTERVLTLEFFNEQLKDAYGRTPIIDVVRGKYRLHPKFRDLYEAYSPGAKHEWNPASFRDHVDDVLATGLMRCRQTGQWDGHLVVGRRYTRRDVCRLLCWAKNQEGTMYGYKLDADTQTCPIFVTHNKAQELDVDVRYPDQLITPSVMHWYSKHGRTLASSDVAPMAANEVDMPLFVKKSDAEGSDFFYLGRVSADNPEATTLPDKDHVEKDVVSMDLTLESPIEQELFEYLNTEARTARPDA